MDTSTPGSTPSPEAGATPSFEAPQIVVDPLDDAFKGAPLGRIYQSVNANSPQPTKDRKFPPYAALFVPQDLAGRKALLARLIEAWKVFTSANFQGERSGQLEQMEKALTQAMPDPEKDPDSFPRFVQDRCHGVFEMLRLLVTMQGQKKNSDGSSTPRGFSKDEVFAETMAMGALALPRGMVTPKEVQDCLGTERDEIMHSRVERIREILKTGPLVELEAYNRVKLGEVLSKFTGNDLVKNIFKSFTKKMKGLGAQLDAPEYTTARWLAVLSNKLMGIHPSRHDLEKQLERLAGALEKAKIPDEIGAAIDTFGDQLDN